MTQELQLSTNGAAPSEAGRFGTFAGVFTPNILTILGIILFLRIGWVVGNAGLWGALAIIGIANMISLLTGLSLSAVATNMRVRAGGNYYLISRSVGLEIGGAIGIPLYLSQAISVAFYIIGFVEALTSIDPFQSMEPRLIATGVAFVFIVIAYVGADFALKIQFIILAVLIASLVSFFLGGLTSDTSSEPVLSANFSAGLSFWAVFAVFFPAVTGIEVGTSLSGDLKDPGKSIPRGTIASIVVTATIYFLVAILLAFNGTADQLINDNLAMERIAVWPVLILAGVWASTLSSALGSILAAPRTLQAIANDAVVPAWVAGRMGSRTEPRAAVLITGVIALIVIWAGELNVVAPVITMFFLNTYGMVNLVAGIEKLVGNPSYRPRFNIPSGVSLLGALGCYAAMFLINPIATLVAIVVSYSVFIILQRRSLNHTWGDVRSGIWFALSRFALLNLEAGEWHVRNWRPNIMVFTGQPHNRQQLIEISEWLSQGQGIVTFFQLLVGDVRELNMRGMRDTALKHIRSYIDDHGMKAFAEVEIVSDFKEGALIVVQAHGIGNLASNVALLGLSSTHEGRVAQLELMLGFVALRKSVLLLRYDERRGYGERKRIDIWWQRRGGNADLMVLLAHIIRQHPTWHDATIHVLRVVDSEEAVDDTQQYMQALLENVRVHAEPTILVREDTTQPLFDIIAERSVYADLTLIGMRLPKDDEIAAYSERIHRLSQVVGSVLFVRNAEADEDLLSPE